MVKMKAVIVDSCLNSFMDEVNSLKDCYFLVSDFISKKCDDNCNGVSVTLYSEGEMLESLNIANFIIDELGLFDITIDKVVIYD